MNQSKESVLRRRQQAYLSLNKQMDQAQQHLSDMRDWSLLTAIEIKTVVNPDPARLEFLKLKQADLIDFIVNENAHILRITKELNILEDRNCR